MSWNKSLREILKKILLLHNQAVIISVQDDEQSLSSIWFCAPLYACLQMASLCVQLHVVSFKVIWGHFLQISGILWWLDLERISVSLFTANYSFEACDSSLHENIANNVIATQWVFQLYPKCWNWNIFKRMLKERACSHISKNKKQTNMEIWNSACMGNTQKGERDTHVLKCDSDSPCSLTWEIPNIYFLKKKLFWCVFTVIKLHNLSLNQKIVKRYILYYFTKHESRQTGLGVLRILHSPRMNHSCQCVCVCAVESKICTLKAADDLLQQNIVITSLGPQHLR